MESTVAIAEQNADGIAKIADHGEIKLAIAREIALNHGLGMQTRGDLDRCLEAAIAVAQHHADAVIKKVGGGKVEVAVTEKINGQDPCGGALALPTT